MMLKRDTSIACSNSNAKSSKQISQILEDVKKNWPKKVGKADYIRFLKGERLTNAAKLRAQCYRCVGGEDTKPCIVYACPLIDVCPWGRG